MAFTREHLVALLDLAMKHNASDIHIRSGEMPSMRILGELVPVETTPFKMDDIKDIAKLIMTGGQFQCFESSNEIDGGYTLEGLCRIRFNYFRFKESERGLIFRIIKLTIKNLDELELPSVLKKIALHQRGLILVTGATGSGKTTTLNAMIDHINKNRSCHILTIEDPIEAIHSSLMAKITQREIGVDTKDYDMALRFALRQDPDVIFIGEMRDKESISAALKAAETGHMVIATLHTTNAVTTIGRIISMFSESEQREVRKRLSESLYATIGQRMLKGNQEAKVYVAQEIMITSPGVKECISGKEPLEKLNYFIAADKNRARGAEGNQSFDDHILDLYNKGLISKKVAARAASSENDLIKKMFLSE